MDLKALQKNWEALGKTDPLYAVLSWPDKEGGKWQLDEFFAHGRNEIRTYFKFIDSLGISFPRKKALDFGCGAGRVTQALVEYFEEVSGVDISSSMIELASRYNRYGQRCKYFHNPYGDLNLFADNSFDFIYSYITLQHMEPQFALQYIKEFLRVLNPRGLLVFQLPSAKHTGARMGPRTDNQPGEKPHMELYAVNKDEVTRFIQAHHGKLQYLNELQADDEFTDYLYLVGKQ